MHKIYLLLRDNKQTGPFNLEELLQLSLKPLDLIWVDGKSMGWMYPGEIEALKPFVPEAPQKQPPQTSSLPGPEPTSSTAAPATILSDKKPGVPPSAKHIFVSFPAIAPNGTPANNKPEETEEDMLERKAEELKARVQAYSEGIKEIEENAEPQTGYTRSLKEIKAEYSSWVHQQQKKKKGWLKYKKGLLVAAVILIFLLTGYFSGKKLWITILKIPQTVAVNLTPDHKLAADKSERAPGNNKERETAVLAKNTVIPALPPSISPGPGNDTANRNELPAIIPQKSGIKKLPATVHRNSTGTDGHDKTGKPIQSTREKFEETTAVNSEQQHLKTEPVAPSLPSVPASVPLSKLIEVSNNNLNGAGKNGSAEYHLTVQNHSDQLINTVAIDVYYYKGKKLLGKKIIYFDNIPPKSSLTLPLPKQKKADTTNYQIGLISSKSGVFYLR